MIIAIDPDTKASGLAFFSPHGKLIEACLDVATYAKIPDAYCHNPSSDEMVIECPQTYGGRAKGNADANDLIRLARVVGRYEQIANDLLIRCRVVLPFHWKGTAPKHITIQRAWDMLSSEEQSVVELTPQAKKKLLAGKGLKDGKSADVMDAVALGLWYLKRKPLVARNKLR